MFIVNNNGINFQSSAKKLEAFLPSQEIRESGHLFPFVFAFESWIKRLCAKRMNCILPEYS